MSKILELRNVWRLMIRRCESSKDTSFKDYGGRGIRVCERWHNFDNFYADMGVRPSGMQIDRIDNNGNYEPGNVRWVQPAQQTRNKRNNINLTLKGRTMCMQDWAVELGIGPPTILGRLRRGWSVEQALTTQAIRRADTDPGEKILTLNGKKQHLAAWARELGVHPSALLYRINAGWSVKRVLTTPRLSNVKLNMRQARAIRATYPKLSAEKIAAKYGVSKKTILNVLHGKIFVEAA